MSNLQTREHGLTVEQLSLIKSSIAKGASDDELALFLYRCRSMGLDPLKPGQIYFVKYGNSPGTIVVGIEGFRARAAATGMLDGIARGVIKDERGKCLGAWCEVKRKDWSSPAREEVSLAEYNTHKGNWTKMPETMIKKVAEAAALRMAFPDSLGGVYTKEEMDQAERAKPQTAIELASGKNHVKPAKPLEPPKTAGDHVVRIGKKFVGLTLSEIPRSELSSFVDWVRTKADEKFRESEDAQEFLFYSETYLSESLVDEAFDNELDQALNRKLEDHRQ